MKKRAVLIILLCIMVIGMPFLGKMWGNSENVVEEEEVVKPEEVEDEEPEAEPKEPELTDAERYPESGHLVAGLRGSRVTVVKQGDPYIESGAYCIDDRSGILKMPMEQGGEVPGVPGYYVEGTVDTNTPGEYSVTYTFITADAKAQVERSVRVVPEQEMSWDRDGISVLMYHYVYDPANPPENLNGNYISKDDLGAQLKWLKDNNYYFPSFAELRAYAEERISLPEKSVILTFDDGEDGFFRYGSPLFKEYEIPAVSFIITVYSGADVVRLQASPYLDFQSHSHDMHRAGGYVGHGGRISAMSTAEIVEDLGTAADICGSRDAFAYPYGDYTDDAREAIRQLGILCSFTTEYDRVRPGMDPTALPRIRVSGDNSMEYWISTL